MNKPGDWKTVAACRDKKQAAEWQLIYGENKAPVKSIVPKMYDLPGLGATMCLDLDVAALAPEQRERLVSYLSAIWGMTEVEADRMLDEVGLPIRLEGVSVSSTDPALMAAMVEDDDLYVDDEEW